MTRTCSIALALVLLAPAARAQVILMRLGCPLLVLLVVACSSAGAVGDATVDHARADLSDGPVPDREGPDLAGPDLAGPDAAVPDGPPLDSPASPDTSPACAYANVDEKLAECGGSYKLILQYVKQSGPAACASAYWVVKGETGQHASVADAAAAGGCDTQCIWSKAISVTMLHCGQKTGYIRWDAPGCPSLFEFPGGLYPTVADFQAAHPCLDGGADA